MPACPHCNAPVPEDAVYCSQCGAAINTPNNSELQKRLEKAMRRNEILTYAAAGLAAATIFVIILIAFL